MWDFYFTAAAVIVLMLSPLLFCWWHTEREYQKIKRELEEMFGDLEREKKNMPTETEKRS